MHSIGSIVSFLHFMLLPMNCGCWKNSGMSLLSTEIMWFGMMSFVKSNQNFDICVRTLPFFVILFLRMWSNAEMRSVATMMMLSPAS